MSNIENLSSEIEEVLQLPTDKNFESTIGRIKALIPQIQEVTELTHHISRLQEMEKVVEENLSKFHLENLKKKEEICSELEKIYGDSDKQKILNLINKSKQLWSHIGLVDRLNSNTIESRFKNDCIRLIEDCKEYLKEQEKLQEVTVANREKLIKQLSEINQLPTNHQFIKQNKVVKQIVEQWKNETPLNHKNLGLNQSFKESLDLFYQKLNQAFEEQKGEKTNNLKRRQTLLTDLTKLAESTTEDNWSKNQNIAINLYREWIKNKIFYDSENHKLEQQFDQVFEELFSKHHQSIEVRVAEKQSLIDELKPLIESVTSENEVETARALMKIKRKWNHFVPLPQGENQKLKQDFQKKIDELNQRCPNLINTISELRKENLEQKKTVLEKVSNLLVQKNSKEFNHSDLMALVKEWEEIGELSQKHHYEMERDFNNLVNPYFKERRNEFKTRQKNDSEKFEKKQVLINRLQVLRDKFKSNKTNPTGEVSVEKLKMMLELNRQMAYAARNDKAELHQEIKSIQKAWNEIGPIHGKDNALYKQYRELCQELYQIK